MSKSKRGYFDYQIFLNKTIHDRLSDAENILVLKVSYSELCGWLQIRAYYG